MLEKRGIKQSMLHKGNCIDNSVAENILNFLKTDLLYQKEFEGIEHFSEKLVAYYNKRIMSKLKGLNSV
ncbi:MAG: hypothetical protein ABRQ27_05100 [Clostridiaceae bacterium]